MTMLPALRVSEPGRPLALASAWLLVGMLVVSVPVVAGQGSIVERARTELEAGHVQDADHLARQALRESPRNPRVHVLLGNILLAEGKMTEASKSFEFALALDPGSRAQVGAAYLAELRRVAGSNPDRAEKCLEATTRYVPDLRKVGVAALFGDALARLRAGGTGGPGHLDHWLTRFPDFVPESEEDLFTLAGYLESKGKRAAAAGLYKRCAQSYPEGKLGQRAAQVLEPRSVPVDRQLEAPCGDQLFVVLRDLVLGYDATKANLSFVWVSGDRAARSRRSFALLPDSKIEIAGQEALPALAGEGAARVVGRDLGLTTDAERRVTLTFPPVPRDAKSLDLELVDNACGRQGQWGRHDFHFRNVSLVSGGAASGSSTAPVNPVAVYHLHSYIVASGHCSGTLRFERDRITYVSGSHSFELPCHDVVRVTTRIEAISDMNVFDPIHQSGLVPTLLIRGRITTNRGKVRTRSWDFLAQDGTPPVLLVAKNLCPTGN